MIKTAGFPLDKAMQSAEYILQLLTPHCEKINLAGSLRRMFYKVGDIEILCQPKREFIQTGLFAEDGAWLVSRDFSEALATITDSVIKGTVAGRYMQIKTTSKKCPGICLDMFMPRPEDYYRMLAIRTGSREYVKEKIAVAWKMKGWVGVSDLGLRRIEECNRHVSPAGIVSYLLKPEVINPTLPPVWESEGQFFTWLGLEYIDPEHRK